MLRVNSEQNTGNGQPASGSRSKKGGSKKVAFIDTVFPTVGVFVAAEIEYLRKQGIDVVILPLRKSNVPFLQDEYRNLIPHIVPRKSIWSMRLFFLATLLTLSRPHLVVKAIADALWDLKGDPVYFLKTAAMLPQLLLIAVMLEREGIKHVHGNWAHYPATAARFIAQLLGVSYSFSAHAGADIYRHPEGLKRKIKDASFVNTCTQANLDYLESLCECSLNGRVKVIYHGIDLSRFDASSVTPETPPLLLSVGNLSEAKGFRYAIEACRILKEKGLDFRYTIVGRGSESATIQKQIDEHKLDGTVVLQNEMPHRQLRETYSRATAFLAPSIITPEGGRDGIPNVLVEAMAMGLPAVASEVSGIPELVKHGVNGLLVPPGDSRALAENVGRLLADSALRSNFSQQAQQTVAEKFDRFANAAVLYRLFLDRAIDETQDD